MFIKSIRSIFSSSSSSSPPIFIVVVGERCVFVLLLRMLLCWPAAGPPSACGIDRLTRPDRCLVPSVMACKCFIHPRILLLRKNHDCCVHQTCINTSVPFSASACSRCVVSSHYTSSEAPQRSEEWFALRKDKLTTSTFSTALGFWQPNRRYELWREKVFPLDTIVLNAAAKAAMNWGVTHEDTAVESYKSITGRDVGSLGFAVHAEAKYGWLGASPDGLLGFEPDGGILEVKCPYNKGKPELGLPWQAVPYYYMPQVQGLMEIMDRNWVDLYCWTPNGSTLFRIHREPVYFDKMHTILKEFWWECVVPAREAIESGREADLKLYQPKSRHEFTGLVIGMSKKLATEAKLLCRDIRGDVKFYS